MRGPVGQHPRQEEGGGLVVFLLGEVVVPHARPHSAR